MELKLSVLIPMYNEEKTAVDTAASLTAFLDKKFPGGDYEILFSNDGSRDRCAELVEKLRSLMSESSGIPIIAEKDPP